MAERTETEVALEATRQADLLLADVRRPAEEGGTPYLLLPEGVSVEDMERLLPAPLRIRAKPAFTDAASFCAYIERFATEETLLFASRKTEKILAELDYHGKVAPSWNTHAATLDLQKSSEWAQWYPKHNAPMGQMDFAEFLEDNLDPITRPEGASVLEMAKFFKVKRDVTFDSQRNLQNGAVQLTFHENETAHAGKGNTEVPETITLELAVYEGGPKYELSVRLRYDLSREGRLSFKLVIAQLQKLRERAFDDICAAVAEKTGLKVLIGTP